MCYLTPIDDENDSKKAMILVMAVCILVILLVIAGIIAAFVGKDDIALFCAFGVLLIIFYMIL